MRDMEEEQAVVRPEALVPGLDMFVPGLDMFVPGLDRFVPGLCDTFDMGLSPCDGDLSIPAFAFTLADARPSICDIWLALSIISISDRLLICWGVLEENVTPLCCGSYSCGGRLSPGYGWGVRGIGEERVSRG